VRTDFAPRSPFLEARPEAAREITRAEEVNRVCARCHQVLFSRYPFTWEGGERRHNPGGSSITSGEARDFLLGGCARRMSCVTCHDPHTSDRSTDLERLGTVAGNAICVRCHGQYAAPAALAGHAHHDPGGAGASCIACHMPRKNMGLGYALTRYHRIGLPDDPARVERDRPLECALCHPGKTVSELVGSMESWWGRRYDRVALAGLYGDLDARPLEATLVRGKAHEQAVALATLGAAGVKTAIPGVRSRSCATTRAARSRRSMARARSISIGTSRRSPPPCAAACPRPSPKGRPAPPPVPRTAPMRPTRTELVSPALSRSADKPPLILLTGFLGAGKTTTLNRVLGAQHHRRIGVIINELGRIDIDTRLIKSRSGDVMELVGGCVCHEVRVQSELWAAIAEVVRRSRPEVVVLETTGIAEPWSILDGLEGLPKDEAPALAAGVVCVVDAEAGGAQLARHEEARAQVEAADRILLTKLDLAPPEVVVALHRELAQRNPAAERASFPDRAEATAELVPWLLETRAGARAPRPREAGPHAHSQLAAVAFSDPEPLLAEPLMAVIDRLGPALVRAKGFVRLAGELHRSYLERAGTRTTLLLGEAWGTDAPRTELVLIGEGLDSGALHRQLWACRASRS
jgi:predicted CXXCH cytochrome family protein